MALLVGLYGTIRWDWIRLCCLICGSGSPAAEPVSVVNTMATTTSTLITPIELNSFRHLVSICIVPFRLLTISCCTIRIYWTYLNIGVSRQFFSHSVFAVTRFTLCFEPAHCHRHPRLRKKHLCNCF